MLNQIIGRCLTVLLAPFTAIWSMISRLIPGLRYLPNMRPELLAAFICFILTASITVIHALIVSFDSNEMQEPYLRTYFALGAISIVLPIVIYFGVKIFLSPPKSPFPDIDAAFDSGLKALQDHGIQIKETPLFLVLGTPDSKTVERTMRASELKFDFSHVTADGQSLYWYGSLDAIYLFLSGIGNVAQLTKDLAKYTNEQHGENEQEVGDFRGTIDVRALGQGKKKFLPPVVEEESQDLMATIRATDLSPNRPRVNPVSEPTERSKPSDTRQLSSREKLTEQKHRLEHFCEILKRRRGTVCALNGIVVCMDCQLVEGFPGQLGRQVKSDLLTVCQSTDVVSNVTAIVTGFETHSGCREFVSRLNELQGDSFINRRFGKSYRSWRVPTPDQMRYIANASIENFDQYIYSIFTQRDALSSRNVDGNREMIKFLCWIYAQFYEGLERTLTTGFCGGESDDWCLPRISGCYFLGVGESSGDSFFGPGIFDRINENQSELEWTKAKIHREANLSFLSQLVFLVGLISLSALSYLCYVLLSAS
ncbi:MAG: hypothetical protein GY748_11215 [Planctomycetaceae bacterium]|nr:hypothetical protein [Planctomycetaceae bacterium]